jgi:hypothetical protein
MDLLSTLSPGLQAFLWGTAANLAGGLATGFGEALLRQGGRRVHARFSPLAKEAVNRAAGAAIATTVADWQLAAEDYRELWERYGAWLLEPAVLTQFSLLINPTEGANFDIELLREEFFAAGLEVERLPQPTFEAMLHDMVRGFYDAAAQEPELQELLKIGLLRRLAEQLGALEELGRVDILT